MDIGFGEYIKMMALPTFITSIFCFICLYVYFYSALQGSFTMEDKLSLDLDDISSNPLSPRMIYTSWVNYPSETSHTIEEAKAPQSNKDSTSM